MICVGLGVAALMHGQTECQHVIGLHAEIDARQVPEAVHGQACASQQRQGQRELAHHQQLAQPMADPAWCPTPAFLQRFSGIEARSVPRRSAAKQQPGERGGGQRKQQDGKVERRVRPRWAACRAASPR